LVGYYQYLRKALVLNLPQASDGVIAALSGYSWGLVELTTCHCSLREGSLMENPNY
jgi:hypothetical protein